MKLTVLALKAGPLQLGSDNTYKRINVRLYLYALCYKESVGETLHLFPFLSLTTKNAKETGNREKMLKYAKLHKNTEASDSRCDRDESK